MTADGTAPQALARLYVQLGQMAASLRERGFSKSSASLEAAREQILCEAWAVEVSAAERLALATLAGTESS
jgi:hypothetical protein